MKKTLPNFFKRESQFYNWLWFNFYYNRNMTNREEVILICI